MDEHSPSDAARTESSAADASPSGPAAPGVSAASGALPGGTAAGTSGPGEAPGLRQEIGATRGAVTRLVQAHIELARSEFTDILDEVKRAGVLVGIAISLVLFVGILVPV